MLLAKTGGKFNFDFGSFSSTHITKKNITFCFRNAWANLGDMSQNEAMMGFIDKVSELMSHLKPHLEALKQHKQEQLIKE